MRISADYTVDIYTKYRDMAGMLVYLEIENHCIIWDSDYTHLVFAVQSRRLHSNTKYLFKLNLVTQ